MARDVNVTKKESIREEVAFNKQQVVAVTLSKKRQINLSGKIRLYSDTHDHEGYCSEELTISEHKDSDGKTVPALTVSKVLTDLQSYQGEPVDLTKLTIDDFLASIIHEKSSK